MLMSVVGGCGRVLVALTELNISKRNIDIKQNTHEKDMANSHLGVKQDPVGSKMRPSLTCWTHQKPSFFISNR